MERNQCNGVKVTFIETQFVTSDAAGFKSLVQRLTGNGNVHGHGDAPPLQRPRPCRAGASYGPRAEEGYHQRRRHGGASAAASGEVGRRAAVQSPPPPPPACLEDILYYETSDLAEMLCADVGASGRSHGGYGGFPC